MQLIRSASGMTLVEMLLAAGVLVGASYLIANTIVFQQKISKKTERQEALSKLTQDALAETRTMPASALPSGTNNCEVRRFDNDLGLDTTGVFPLRVSSTSTQCKISGYSSPGYYIFLKTGAIPASQVTTINSKFSTNFLKLPTVTNQIFQIDVEGNYLPPSGSTGDFIPPIQITSYHP